MATRGKKSRGSTKARRSPNLIPNGKLGLNQRSGRVNEEWHRKLSGSQWLRVAREMRDNNPTIAASLHAVTALIRGAPWEAEPASQEERARAEAEWLTTVFDDLPTSWGKTAAAAVDDASTFGFAPHEVLHKLRRGPNQQDPLLRSKYDDGRIGLREIAVRAAESTDEWEFDGRDNWVGWYQRVPSTQERLFVPREKMWVFQTDDHKNNPQGRPLTRHCYRPYRKLTGLEDMEAVVIQRSGAPIPVARMPLSYFDGQDQEKAEVRDDIVEKVSYLGVNRLTAVAYPKDDAGEWDIGYMASGSNKPIDISPIIDRYRRDMSIVWLTQFLYLGSESTGSFALSSDMTNLFAVSLGALLDELEESVNREIVDPLYELNGVPPEFRARWKHGDIEDESKTALAETLLKLVTGGLITPDNTLEEYVRRIVELPERDEPEATEGYDPIDVGPDLPDGLPDMPGADAVQDTGLNGAQVTALLDTLERVTTVGLPKTTARAVISASFPSMPSQLIDQMLADIQEGATIEPEAPGGPPPFAG